jgi:threonine/homoserine/homoserine lactone efflux protein
MQELVPLAIYSFVMSITPGPNNVMVTASGALFGYRRTVPHLLGVSLGAALQTALVCLGLGLVFERFPVLHEVLRWAGAAYLAWLGWRIFASGLSVGEAKREASPIGFIAAALFQLLNPKAWMMALTIATLFLPREVSPLVGSLIVGAVLALVNYPCISVWALFGAAMRRVLTDPYRRRWFNAILAIALAVTGVAMVWM